VAQTLDQIGNCPVARRNVETRMGVSNAQFVLQEGCPKLFVYGVLADIAANAA
jgi:hypothetical protein